MDPDRRELWDTIFYNVLKKKPKSFTDVKGFPKLLNISIFLHSYGFVLLLAFLLSSPYLPNII